MRRFVPRALLTAAVTVAAAACTVSAPPAVPGAAPGSVALPDDPTGRAQVLVPALVGANQGNGVADEVRKLIGQMQTHTPVDERAINGAMRQFGITELNEATARQLAQQMNAQVVLFGSIEQAGTGFNSDLSIIDIRSGEQIRVENVAGPDEDMLAQQIFTTFEASMEGIRRADACRNYIASEQYELALDTCNQALTVVPTSTSALLAKATALNNLDRNDEALAVYRELLEIDPVHQDALLAAGLAASHLQSGEEAVGFYNRYIELNPGNDQIRLAVATEAAKTGDYLSAFQLLEPAIATNRTNAEFQRFLFTVATASGQRVQEQQDAAAARRYYEVARDAYIAAFSGPDAELDQSALRLAIAVNTALGDTQAALRIAREATVRFDTVPSIWSQYANVLAEADQHAEAAQALTRVVELDPRFEDVYLRRARAFLESGNEEQALADFGVAAERGNREMVARTLYGMAGAPIREERFADAAKYLAVAHQYADGNVKSDIAFFWGYMLYKQGEALARANTANNAAQARDALVFFEQALPLLQSSSHANAPPVLTATQQYIQHQRAVAGRG